MNGMTEADYNMHQKCAVCNQPLGEDYRILLRGDEKYRLCESCVRNLVCLGVCAGCSQPLGKEFFILRNGTTVHERCIRICKNCGDAAAFTLINCRAPLGTDFRAIRYCSTCVPDWKTIGGGRQFVVDRTEHYPIEERLADLRLSHLHCKRENGTNRAWFETPEAAAAQIREHPAYAGDIVVLCGRCGYYHCSNPNWNISRPWETPITDVEVN